MSRRPTTIKKSKSVYIIGSITIGIVALLAVYFVLIATGVISAMPIRIVVATGSATFEYDGEEHVVDEWWLDSGELKKGHELRVTVTGARTEAGESANDAICAVYDDSGYDVTDSYAIDFKTGKITVAPRKVVVSSASGEKQYDGTPLTAPECSIASGSLVDGHEISYAVNGAITASGKTDNTFVATVSDGKIDVSKNYDLEYLYGTLYVHGELIEISTASAEKIYDGTPLTANDYSITRGNIRSGDVLEIDMIGTQTEIGSSDNKATGKVTDSGGADVTAGYELVFAFGTLTVKPIKLVVETASDSKVYDGTPLTAPKWHVADDKSIAGNVWLDSKSNYTVGEYTISAEVVGARTVVGISENSAVYVTVTKDGKDASGDIEIEERLGTLTVMPRPLTVLSGSANKKFDGDPLTCDEWETLNKIYPVADGHEVRVTVTGTITFVGTMPNTIAEVAVFDTDGNDVTLNYSVTRQEGQLVIYDDGQSPGGTGAPEQDGNGEGDGDGENGENEGTGGNVDESGKLDGSGGDPSASDPDLVVMRVKATSDGELYLKYMSYGDYDLNGWNSASAYAGAIKELKNESGAVRVSFGMNYIAGVALESTGVMAYNGVTVDRVNTDQYFLPYYINTDETAYTVQGSDCVYSGDKKNCNSDGHYVAHYYDYDYIKDNGAALDGVKLGKFAPKESEYASYVEKNYLAVPSSTAAGLESIVTSRGFDMMSGSKQIRAVVEYVRSAATYNLDYDKTMDGADDVVLAFLNDYKEGVCRHYASAATLIFRMLDIPARYCVGYSCTAKADEWVEVTGARAHAWTEIYIDGVGWIMLEVTGGGASSAVSDFGDISNTDITVIKPYDTYLSYKDYDGTSLTYDKNRGLQGMKSFTEKGYTYKFEVAGAQAGLGIGESRITEFALFDKDGNDVTFEHHFRAETGILHIYMTEIAVSTPSLEKIYDGTTLYSENGDEVKCLSSLMNNHKISDIVMTGMQRYVGSSQNTCALTITDGRGDDVTYMYKVNFTHGTLTVKPRPIVITADSKIVAYAELNGGALTCPTYTVTDADGNTEGVICEGETLAVTIKGEQRTLGYSSNDVESVVITDADGKDVTGNYDISRISGMLYVLPRT